MSEDRLIELVKLKCLFRGDYTLRSGQKTSYYLNLRRLTLSAELAEVVSRIDHILIRNKVPFQAFGGPEAGANQLVGGLQVFRQLGDERPIRGFVVRKKQKDYGDKQSVVGDALPGDTAVLIEDTVTTGESLLHAYIEAERFGLKVVYALAVVDRLAGAEASLRAVGVPYSSIITVKDLGLKPEV